MARPNNRQGGPGGNDRGRGPGSRGPGSRGPASAREEAREAGLLENVVKINRCAKVMKGGRRFSFSALVVVGDGKGKVGVGFGKANDVPTAVEKGVQEARKSMTALALVEEGRTIPHPIRGAFGAAKVTLLPAPPGTGVIAGASVRAVLTCAGIKDILTKSLGSPNPVNLVKATFEGLTQARTKEQVEALRGVEIPG